MKWFMAAFILGLALPGGQGETVTVTGKAGDHITLQTGVTGLHGDYQVIWSTGEERRVIVHFDEGDLILNTSERFHLDIKTGSLTIRPLSINDTGLYKGQIINGNGSQHSFNLTVVEADPIKPTDAPLDNITAYQWKYLATALSVVLFVLVCIVLLLCAFRWKIIKGKCRCNSEVV